MLDALRARRFSALALTAFIVGAGIASSQDGPPGQLDTECYGYCAANGYEAGFCNQVCWIPTSPATRAPTDYGCVNACLERGGSFEGCRPQCRRP